MISVISSHASTFVASGNSYLFHYFYNTTKCTGEAAIRGGELLLLLTKCLITSDAFYVGPQKRALSPFPSEMYHAVRLPAI